MGSFEDNFHSKYKWGNWIKLINRLRKTVFRENFLINEIERKLEIIHILKDRTDIRSIKDKTPEQQSTTEEEKICR